MGLIYPGEECPEEAAYFEEIEYPDALPHTPILMTIRPIILFEEITSIPQEGSPGRPCSPAPEIPPIKEEYLPADRIEIKDLGPCETAEYITGVGYGCNDATDSFNNEERDDEYMYDDD